MQSTNIVTHRKYTDSNTNTLFHIHKSARISKTTNKQPRIHKSHEHKTAPTHTHKHSHMQAHTHMQAQLTSTHTCKRTQQAFAHATAHTQAVTHASAHTHTRTHAPSVKLPHTLLIAFLVTHWHTYCCSGSGEVYASLHRQVRSGGARVRFKW